VSRVRSWLAAPLGARLLGAALALAGVALLVVGVLALNGDDPGTPGAAPAPTASGTPSGLPTPTGTAPAPTRTPTAVPTTAVPTTTAPRRPPPPTATPAPPRAPLTVLNNSTIRGLGDQAAAEAQRRGWRVAQVGNFAGRLPVTTVYFTPGSAAEERAARQFAEEFPQVEQVLPRYEGLPPTPAGIVLVVTRDWAD
jgi:LytR cell envelope-related transcriptional attenuator